jgi:cell division topological specificity factor
MRGFLDRLTGQNRSAHEAKERLQLVLIHDRTNLTNAVLETLKDEIIEVLSRHVEIDPEMVKMEFDKDGRQQRLIADIPIRGPRRKR